MDTSSTSHFIFISFLFNLSDSVLLVRLIFCSISILVPYFFYLNLKLRFNSINEGKLLILSSTILLLPFFRSSAICLTHISYLCFLSLFQFIFLTNGKKFSKKIDYTFITLSIFSTSCLYETLLRIFLYLLFYLLFEIFKF